MDLMNCLAFLAGLVTSTCFFLSTKYISLALDSLSKRIDLWSGTIDRLRDELMDMRNRLDAARVPHLDQKTKLDCSRSTHTYEGASYDHEVVGVGGGVDTNPPPHEEPMEAGA